MYPLFSDRRHQIHSKRAITSKVNYFSNKVNLDTSFSVLHCKK